MPSRIQTKTSPILLKTVALTIAKKGVWTQQFWVILERTHMKYAVLFERDFEAEHDVIVVLLHPKLEELFYE